LVTEPFLTTMPDFFGMTLAELRQAVDGAAWVEFEKGQLSEAEFCQSFFLDRRTIDTAALRACLTNTYQWIDGMRAILADLCDAEYSIHALSNYPVWYEMIEQKLELSEFLEWTFVSCLTGLRKPDEQAFLGAALQLGVTPAECIFIDDRDENVEAARSLGMLSLLMDEPARVREELEQRSVLPPKS
jgi:FMN phosphatase YigB (HAD superfamily)